MVVSILALPFSKETSPAHTLAWELLADHAVRKDSPKANATGRATLLPMIFH